MPVRVVVTEGTRADCKEACALIDGVSAGVLLADRGYDTESILRKAGESGCQVVIPPKKSRKIVVKYHATMTESSTKSGILSRMLFSISNAGEELLHGMSKDAPLFLPPFKLDAYLCGQIQFDDTV